MFQSVQIELIPSLSGRKGVVNLTTNHYCLCLCGGDRQLEGCLNFEFGGPLGAKQLELSRVLFEFLAVNN